MFIPVNNGVNKNKFPKYLPHHPPPPTPFKKSSGSAPHLLKTRYTCPSMEETFVPFLVDSFSKARRLRVFSYKQKLKPLH